MQGQMLNGWFDLLVCNNCISFPLFPLPLSTIFSELMENMEVWYMSSALEADFFKTKIHANGNRKMQHDPRTQKPFESSEVAGVSGHGNTYYWEQWELNAGSSVL